MENEKLSIQEFKSPGNCSSRSQYIQYDFLEFLKEREPSENDAPKSCTVQKSQILPSEGKLTFFYKELIFKSIFIESKWGYFVNYINDLSKIITYCVTLYYAQ